ncbi:MAG TPA: helix-turn-helix domain-containing protein [Solirubrobacterales bacterium]|nr:helix-turn-helix domain-containing protein [Solirubrobacterales bacterium]
MERELLEECLTEGLSLEAIGKRAGKHESTVSYWLKKHGLEAARTEKHSAKGPPSKEEMERLLAAGLSLREMARRLDRSLGTIRHWMRRYELKAVPHRHNGPRDGRREATLSCRRHGRTTFVLEGRGSYRCKQCRVHQVARRRRKIKRLLVEEAGGRCVLCGYDRHLEALQFHHLEPGKKLFHLGQDGQSRSLARCRAEAMKCALLCANCHAEVEAGKAALPLNFVPSADPG